LHKRSTEQRRAPPLTGVAEPKAAADFMLAACLPAMDSFANLEKIAQQKSLVFSSYSTEKPIRRNHNASRSPR
jgi:hypothetical protein